MLKIAFDGSDLGTMRSDGTTRYTLELLKRLPALSPQFEWLVYSPLESAALKEAAKHTPNIRLRITPWPYGWTQFRLPVELYRDKPDLLFMPIQQLPFVRPGKLKTISVVHDLAFHQYGEQFRFKDWILLHAFTATAVRQGDRVIAVSAATARDIEYFYDVKEKVTVIHHGIDRQKFYRPTSAEKAAGWEKLITAYPRLTKPYALYLGQIQPRKNIERLIEAFEKFENSNQLKQLVIAGGHGWLQEPIRRRARNSAKADDIFLTGPVQEELLAPWYWHAEVFVLPSLNEGFGMPILEAMACGCPVVTSNCSAMAEVAGEAAVLIDPLKPADIEQGIRKAISEKTKLIKAGEDQVRRFSWDRCAAETVKIIMELIGGS